MFVGSASCHRPMISQKKTGGEALKDLTAKVSGGCDRVKIFGLPLVMSK